MTTIQSAKLLSVPRLYRDALRVAEIVAFQQGTQKSTVMSMVRGAFRAQAHLSDEEDILTAKQAAITAMGNYHAVKAVELALKYRDVPVGMQRSPKVPSGSPNQ